MKADIYDFDRTVIPFDSGSRFAIYCILRHPLLFLLLPYYFADALLLLFRIISLNSFKKHIFIFVRFINLEKNVKGFWDRYEKYVYPWARKESRERPAIVISASPDFLLEEIQKRLGFEYLICTRHDRKTGTLLYKNCRGEEKVRRFNELFTDEKPEIECVYSDSIKNDRPIFSLGKHCFHVHSDGSKEEFVFDEMYP
ncbi:MAG: hypothetical protein E7514_05085 [Ruminococcaceae bacterium]|nr:hypothetical protein [Oscillospiraceae bacterium]